MKFNPALYVSQFMPIRNCLAIVVILLLNSCAKEQSIEVIPEPQEGTIVLSFTHAVRNQPLTFTDEFTNDWGETYTVNRFKYYLHDIRLLNDKGKKIMLSGDYYLVDEENSPSKTILLKAPVGTYAGIAFTLGVDSVRNVSGAQTGVLDPANGMFWTWASGYITAKLEGHSDYSTGFQKIFTYHIGGYKSPYIAYKNIQLPLIGIENFAIVKDSLITATIRADINTWFSRVNSIHIADNPACHSPGDFAKKIADNYEGMFSIQSIQ